MDVFWLNHSITFLPIKATSVDNLYYPTCCRGIVGYWSVLDRQSLATNSTISNRRSRTAGKRCAICRRVAGDCANLASRQQSTTHELCPVVDP